MSIKITEIREKIAEFLHGECDYDQHDMARDALEALDYWRATYVREHQRVDLADTQAAGAVVACEMLRGRAERAEAEVARHVTNLAECYRIAGADPDGNTDAVLARDAVRAVMDLRRDYDQACEDDHRLRGEIVKWLAEVRTLRAIAVERKEQVEACEKRLTESQAEVARLRAAVNTEILDDADEAEYPDTPEFERECAYRKGWNDCARSVYRAARKEETR